MATMSGSACTPGRVFPEAQARMAAREVDRSDLLDPGAQRQRQEDAALLHLLDQRRVLFRRREKHALVLEMVGRLCTRRRRRGRTARFALLPGGKKPLQRGAMKAIELRQHGRGDLGGRRALGGLEQRGRRGVGGMALAAHQTRRVLPRPHRHPVDVVQLLDHH